MRALVAEDDPNVRLLLRRLLAREGYEVIAALDGIEALEKLRAEDFDVVILDLMMPKLNGFEILARLHRDRPEALRRIVVVTAFSRQLDLQSEICAVVSKPFDIAELTRTVNACARRDAAN